MKDLIYENQGWKPVKLTPEKQDAFFKSIDGSLPPEAIDKCIQGLKDESLVLLEKDKELILTHRNPARRSGEIWDFPARIQKEQTRLLKEFIYYQIFGASLFLTFLYGIWAVIPNVFLAIFISNTIAFVITKNFINKQT